MYMLILFVLCFVFVFAVACERAIVAEAQADGRRRGRGCGAHQSSSRRQPHGAHERYNTSKFDNNRLIFIRETNMR